MKTFIATLLAVSIYAQTKSPGIFDLWYEVDTNNPCNLDSDCNGKKILTRKGSEDSPTTNCCAAFPVFGPVGE